MYTSASRITICLALEFADKPYDLSASSNASRLTIRLADVCSKGPRCVFNALDCVKLQRKHYEHPSASRITIRLALELAGKPYDLPASSNARRISKRLANGCSEELGNKTYDLSASSNASRLTIRLVDVCSEGLRCVFSALDCVKLQRGTSEHPFPSRITIRLALELADKPCDLSASYKARRITIQLADGCSKDPRCVFNALDCVKFERGPSEHLSASRITIRLALELAEKPYDLSPTSNSKRITKRLAYGCSEGPRCVFSALDFVNLQRELFEHPSASRITIRLALELAGKSYDLPASSNASRLTIRLADGCSKAPRCVFCALDCVKVQRVPYEHPSTNRITIRLALKFAGKTYDLPTSSNAKRITKRLADGCSEGPCCVFNALNCVKLQRKPFEHPSASRIIIRLALELAGKPYDLPTSSTASRLTIRFPLKLGGKPYDLQTSSNARRLTIRLADGCSERPRCVFNVLDCVKLQRETSEHTSVSRITIRFALEFVDKPYDLPASSNAKRITIRIADVCSEDLRCVFNALDCVKLQRGPSEHLSASHITIRLTLELAEKPYDLLASSNAKRITKRIADERSEGSRYVFSALDSVKLQRGPFEHPSASRITIRLALELTDKTYDLPTSSNASRLTIRLADGCSEELVDNPYDLSASSNARCIIKRLIDACSEGPHCVFSALDSVKWQRGPFEHPSALNFVKLQRGHSEHPSASRITIRFALELAGKPYDLLANSNAKRIIIRLADGCSKDSRCVFSALDYVKLQREPSEHSSGSRITIRLALELAEKPNDLPASSNAKRIIKRLVDGCSEGPRCVFSALDSVKLQCGPFMYPSASRITICLALEFADKPYDLSTSFNARQLTIRLADVCSEGPRCIFNALYCVKLQRKHYEHSSASRITIRLALELAGKPYDLPASSNARRISKRLADGCSEGPH
ncbi:hypothetical protein L7F22_040206 [Adiantum nelumboides]|nr:hypothetical protein [Adiantum nelumboides]